MLKKHNILARQLFIDEPKDVIRNDIKYEMGRLRNGGIGVYTIWLEDDDANFHKKMNRAVEINGKLGLAVDIPSQAADIWIDAYDTALESGSNAFDAEKIAWAAVKEKWRKRDGKWTRFSADWKEQVHLEFEPEIEIVTTGTHEGSRTVTLDHKHLQQMVENFDKELVIPAITNDHRQHGASFGTVKSLYVSIRQMGEGKVRHVLMAKLTGLAKRFVEKVKAGEYVNRSIEFYKNYKDGEGTLHGAVLTAISFLGAAEPAAKGMKAPAFSTNGELWAFSIDNDKDNRIIIPSEDAHKGSLNHKTKKGNKNVLEITKEELTTQINAAVEAKATKLTAEFETKLDDQKTALEAEKKTVEGENEKLKTKLSDDRKAGAHDEAVKLADDYADPKEGKILPAQKEQFVKLFEKAILSEDENELKDLKTLVKANGNQVEFAELVKSREDKDELKPGDGTVKLSEEGQNELAEVAEYMTKQKWPYELNALGFIVPEKQEHLQRAISAVKGASK